MIPFTGEPRTLFLSWSAPACCLVARELLRRGHTDPEAPSVVVVPTRESARLLREQLAILSSAQPVQRAFLSPRIIPLPQLVANDARSIPKGVELMLFQAVLAQYYSHFPSLYPKGSSYNAENWLREAQQIIRIFSTLSQEGLHYQSNSWQQLATEDASWKELADLQKLLNHKMQELGYQDITQNLTCSIPQGTRLIFACVPKIPQAIRKMLSGGHYALEFWVHAKPQQAEMFDAWGCPTMAWLQSGEAADLGLDNPEWKNHYQQAADLWKMAQLSGIKAAELNAFQRTPHQLSIAVCDAAMEPALEEELTQHHGKSYRPQGVSFKSSFWFKLLRELQGFIAALELGGMTPKDSILDYPAPFIIRLFKMPALLKNIVFCELEDAHLLAMVQMLDEIQFHCIPTTLMSLCRQLRRKKLAPAPDCLEALELIGLRLQHALETPSDLLDTLKEWVLAMPPRDAQERDTNAYFLHEIEQLQEHLSQSNLDCRHLLLLLELNCQTHHAAATRPTNSLDLLGWVELFYSPSPNVIIAGLHEGVVPERNESNALLNPKVIQALGLPSDEQRAAKDAYQLRSIIACRGGEKCFFFFTHYDEGRNPLSPSSLLMQLCPDKQLPAFVSHFFTEQEDTPRSEVLDADDRGWNYRSFPLSYCEFKERAATLTCEQLHIRNPMKGKAFSPSTLKLYLQCPLRFWLSKIFNLDANTVEEGKKNLSTQEQGNCLHVVLEDFLRRYPSWQSVQDAGLEEGLEAELIKIFERKYQASYGKRGLLPQELQRDGLRRRLLAFLPLQRGLWNDGWEVARDQDGQLMLEYKVNWKRGKHRLSMTIDRVDTRINEEGLREYRVIDYKTGKIDTVIKSHLKQIIKKDVKLMDVLDQHQLHTVYLPMANSKSAPAHWLDLQLPIYADWLQRYTESNAISVAYIHLARSSDEVKLLTWESPAEKIGLFDEFADQNPPITDNIIPTKKVYPLSLHESAMQWADACMDLIAAGQCFISAEQLNWKLDSDYLFKELNKINDIEKLFFGSFDMICPSSPAEPTPLAP